MRRTVITALFLAGLALLGAPAAQADSLDDAFYHVLQTQGWSVSEADAVHNGKLVCAWRNQRMEINAVVARLSQQAGINTEWAEQFIGIAFQAYCPEYLSTPAPKVPFNPLPTQTPVPNPKGFAHPGEELL